MDFLEELESYESGPPAARSTRSAPPARRPPPPSSGGRGTTPAPSRDATRSAPPPGATGPSRRAPAPGARPGATTAPGRRPAAPGRRPSEPRGFNLDQFGQWVRRGLDVAQQGYQVAQQFGAFGRPGGPAPGAPAPVPPDAPAGAHPAPMSPAEPPAPTWGPEPGAMAPAPEPVAAPAPGGDQLALLLHALQQRQIAPLPGAPAYAMPSLPVAAPVPAPAAQPDALGLLRMILGNPQFQQAMQLSPVTGYAPRSLELPVPAAPPPAAMRRVPIPLGAIMNTISALAAQSMTDLNATTREDEPEVPAYLVGDDGDFIVDPADADQRAALVAHLFRLSDEAQRSGWYPQAEAEAEDEAEDEYQLEAEMDESEEWARQAGFTW